MSMEQPDVTVLRQAFDVPAATIPVPDDVFVEAVDACGVPAERMTVGAKAADMEIRDTILRNNGVHDDKFQQRRLNPRSGIHGVRVPSRPGKPPRWNYAIRQTKQVGAGTVGAGTIYRQVRSLPHPMEETIAVAEYEPDRRLVFQGGLGPFGGSSAYHLEPVGDATRVVNEVELTASGPRAALAGMARHAIKHAVAKDLQVLKSILEHA